MALVLILVLMLAVNEAADIEAQLNRRLNVCLTRAELEAKPNYTRCYLEHIILRKRYGLPDPKELPPTKVRQQ